MKGVLLLVCGIAMAGCTAVNTALDATSDQVVAGIDKYCSETSPAVREQLRTKVNTKLDGHTVVITCKLE